MTFDSTYANEFKDHKNPWGIKDKLLEQLNPEDVIYFRHYFDTTYDRASEDMGHFYDVIFFSKDGKPEHKQANPGDPEPIIKFLKRSGDIFIKDGGNAESSYTNKNYADNIRFKDDVLIYKNKYKFDLKYFA